MSHAFPPEFTNELCIKLIQMYEVHRVLWDSTIINYRNTNLREDAWTAISKDLGIPVGDLKKKMKTLLATNRKERSKTKKRVITGSGADNVFKSKWFAYDYFLFLNDKDMPSLTQDTMQAAPMESSSAVQNCDSNNISALSTLQQAPNKSSSSTQQRASHTSPASTQQRHNRSYRKKRRLNSDGNDKTLAKAMGLLRQRVHSQSGDDSYTSFGIYIAHELRKYDMRTLTLVKHAINNTIFQADMGQLPGQSYGYCSSNYSANSTPCHSVSTPSPAPAEILPEALPTYQKEITRDTDIKDEEEFFNL